MHPTLKTLAFRCYDLVTLPLTAVSACHMWLLRRYGIPNFPLARRQLLRQGVFPIRRHFSEPQFHPDDLSPQFGEERHLPGIAMHTDRQLELLKAFRWQGELERFARPAYPVLNDGTKFELNNCAFSVGDIDFYYQMIRHARPRRIIEIGSGHSTIVALSAIEQCMKEDPNYACDLSAIEPYPWFKHASLRLVPKRVEEVPLSDFEALEAGDILFIDSSHMLRPCGDVEHEFLRILPVVKPGVYIHIHDVFTPFNYPDMWVKSWHSFWNEQYVMEALLSGGGDYEVFAALHYLSRRHTGQARQAMPLLSALDRQPHSFWIRKVKPSNGS